MGVEVLVRPDRSKRAYRLRCRFRVEAFPNPGFLERAKFRAAETFVEDMHKQGWEYLNSHGFKMTGPFPAIEVVNLPKRSLQPRWHQPSQEVLQRIMAGQRVRATGNGFASDMPGLGACEKWEYELAGVFVHNTILTETPEDQEAL